PRPAGPGAGAPGRRQGARGGPAVMRHGGRSQNPLVAAKAGTQFLLDSRFRGNERSFNAAVVASLFMPPGGPALVEKCLDAFSPLGRRARFGDAAGGQGLERVVDRTTRDLGNEPFRARL